MNVAIIDGQLLIVDMIRDFLAKHQECTSIKGFTSAGAFLEDRETADSCKLIFMDSSLPDINGLLLIKQLRATYSTDQLKIAIVSATENMEHIKDCIKSGANAYLSKNESVSELAGYLKVIDTNEHYFSTQLKKKLVNALLSKIVEDPVPDSAPRITKRENGVLQLLCKGMSVKEIARQLALSIHTVQSYQKKLLKKLNFNKTVDLVVYAVQNGLYTS